MLLAEQLKYDAPVEKWKAIRDAIHKEICAQGLRQAERIALCRPMDRTSSMPPCCSCRRLAFLPGSDPRVKATVKAIERELMPNGLVLRYNTIKGRRRPAARRRRVSCLQLLDGERPARRSAASAMRARCLRGFCACATISACFPRNTTWNTSAWWETFPGLFAYCAGQCRVLSGRRRTCAQACTP